MTDAALPDAVRLQDIKDRKGHGPCRGGEFDMRLGPMCGCGVALDQVSDLMPAYPVPSADGYEPLLADPPPPFTHASGEPCYGCQSCFAEILDDDTDVSPPVDVDADGHPLDPEVPGKELVDRHAPPDMTPGVPLLDPTAPFGPAEIEARILEANARLERGAIHEANLVASAEALGIEYTLAYAKALAVSSGGAADQRKADATIATERLYRQWKETVAAMKAMQSVTHTLRSTLSGYQSVGKSIGANYGATTGRGR